MMKEIRDAPALAIKGETPSTQETGWWATYEKRGLKKLSPTAKSVVKTDSRTISETASIERHNTADDQSIRVRTGIVIGAVQSGKTASMLGSAANLLDNGLDILVILAGTRLVLWRQTYERLIDQLDGEYSRRIQRNRRLLIPSPQDYSPDRLDFKASDYIASAGSQISRALSARKPIIFVVPKVESHLDALTRAMEQAFREVSEDTDPFHIVVFDDEADDASVLDATDSKSIPRRIERLWAGLSPRSNTLHPCLYATYVAYTATPQANFMQEVVNPLSPTDFCLALRAPYVTGNPKGEQRNPTFQEPLGLNSYYCGGDFFYEEFSGLETGRLCRTFKLPTQDQFTDDESWLAEISELNVKILFEGIRAYLVAAAIKLHKHLKAQGYGNADIDLEKALCKDEAKQMWPQPHSCLIHPSAAKSDHFQVRERIVAWSMGYGPEELITDPSLRRAVRNGSRGVDSAGLTKMLNESELEWRSWHYDYGCTLTAITDKLPMSGYLKKCYTTDWEAIRKTLIDHIFPAVNLKVINSDKTADDRPSFKHRPSGSGTVQPPEDLLTIFISGNVMSRGITIEGLTTSIFLRSASSPAADTQMQMQRWFGYRGQFAHLVRLFTYEDQLRHFRDYHHHDVLDRTEILKNMDLGADGMSPKTLLQGRHSSATRKVPTQKLPLHPGPSPAIKLLERTHGNVVVIEEFFREKRNELVAIDSSMADKGLILPQQLSLLELADLCDTFAYSDHDPIEASGDVFSIWATLKKRYNFPQELAWFRPARDRQQASGKAAVRPSGCPYMIAAYLRFWHSALQTPNLDALFATDKPRLPWKTDAPTMTAPKFYIGIRSGSLPEWDYLPAIQCVKREAFDRKDPRPDEPLILKTLWGPNSDKNNPGEYLGDRRFDYHYSGLNPPDLPKGRDKLWRPRGHPGLLLFHVIRSKKNDSNPLITIGLCLPHGGPSQFLALKSLALK
jgi:hypothetical protein